MADFRFFVNRQGPRGPQGLQGEKGDPGNTFTVSEGVNTPTEYTLIFDGGDGNQFETDNLRNPIVDRGGTYVRYDRDNVTQYIGEPDMAVIDGTPGIVNLAGKDTVTPNASDAVAYELLEKTVDELNTTLESLDGRLDDAEGALEQTQGDLTQAQSDIVGLDNRVTTNEGNITSLQSGKADKSTTYTKTEVNNALAGKANAVHTHTVSQITNAGALASQNTVDYQTQVTNKPTIPTVGNGTITLTQGGVTKGTFTTNQSGNSTIDLDAGGSSSFTEGNAINISDNTISVKYDGTTIGLNASGQLEANIPTPETVDQTYDGTSTHAQSGVAIAGAGFLTSVPTATSNSKGLVQPDGTSITINDGVISAAGSAPSNMVTTNTQQIITGRKDMAIINMQPSGSTGYMNYITPIGNGRIAISKVTNYDVTAYKPGIILDYSSGGVITAVASGGNPSRINLCTEYGNNTAEIRFCNGFPAGGAGNSHSGIGKYGNYTYIRNNNANDKKVYKITTGGTTSSDFTNFFLEKDMLDGTTISYDSATGKISTSGFVPTSRTVNNKALSSDITLTAEDIGALPDDTVLLKQYSDGLNEYGDLVNTSGILSGFSNDNYASIPGYFFKPGHTIIVKFNYVTKTTARQYILSSEGFLNIDINTNSTQLRTWDNSASTQVNVGSTMTSGSDYYLKIVLKDTGKDFYLTTDPSNWGTATTVADTAYLTAEIPNNQVYLGLNIAKSNSYWNSTIDSNYIEIYDEDDILIYSSQDNTDIATISRLGVTKPDGTTLTVDKEGVLSANIKSGMGTGLTTNGNLNLLVSDGDIIEATDTLPTGYTRTYTYSNTEVVCNIVSGSTGWATLNTFLIDKKYITNASNFEVSFKFADPIPTYSYNTYYNIVDIPNIIRLESYRHDADNPGRFCIYNYKNSSRNFIPDFSYDNISQLIDKNHYYKISVKNGNLLISFDDRILWNDTSSISLNSNINDDIRLAEYVNYYDNMNTNIVLDIANSYIKSNDKVTWGLCGDNGVAKASETTYGLVTKNHPMPGDSYDSITVGASGATYNMTNTGWLCFDFGVKANNQYLEVSRTINNTNILLYKNQMYGTTNSSIACIIPVKKGDVIAVSYNVTGTKHIYFIPAVS